MKVKRYEMLAAVAALLALLLGGCIPGQTADLEPTAEVDQATTAASTPKSPLPLSPSVTPEPGSEESDPTTVPSPFPSPEGATTMSATEAIEAVLKADLAGRLDVPESEIQTESVETRTWPDAGLGCRARRGVLPPERIPGYLILLQHNGQSYAYHTDQAGNFVYCPATSKPFDRIQ
jgi:hypothetical protein